MTKVIMKRYLSLTPLVHTHGWKLELYTGSTCSAGESNPSHLRFVKVRSQRGKWCHWNKHTHTHTGWLYRGETGEPQASRAVVRRLSWRPHLWSRQCFSLARTPAEEPCKSNYTDVCLWQEQLSPYAHSLRGNCNSFSFIGWNINP